MIKFVFTIYQIILKFVKENKNNINITSPYCKEF